MQCNSDWACRLKTGSRSLLCFLPAFITLTSALGSTAALADACGEETAALKSIARGVEVTIRAPEGGTADAAARISWRATQPAPLKVPAYIAIAIPGDVRFRVAPIPPKPPAPDNDLAMAMANRLPELPGFLALTPQTRGPLGLEFGKGATRALVPLHQPDARLAGEFEIEGLAAGPLTIEAAVVARTSCGERVVFRPVRPYLRAGTGCATHRRAGPIRHRSAPQGHHLEQWSPSRAHFRRPLPGLRYQDRSKARRSRRQGRQLLADGALRGRKLRQHGPAG